MPGTAVTTHHKISKSRLLSGLQCPKKLYLEVHKPLLSGHGEDANQRMQRGDRVGELARKLAPGIFLDDAFTLNQALTETERLLAINKDVIIHEATFTANGLLVRGDTFMQDDTGHRLYEVKSSTGVKAYQLTDCAIQSWVIEQAGYPLDEVFVRHIDKSFVYTTLGDYTGLFRDVPVSQEIAELKVQVPDWLDHCQSVLSGDLPDIETGAHCKKPFPCPFQSFCCTNEQADYPVSTLPRGKKLAEQLVDEGIHDIRDIPEGRLKKPLFRRIREAVIMGKPYVAPELSLMINALPYPRYYIDFETVNPAIPLWIDTRPYEQVPFQWSCHIEYEDGRLEHKDFLEISGESPMRAFIESLLDIIGNTGPILVYNASFERRILRDMGNRFPEHEEKISATIERIVDLLEYTRKHYYHPAMHGSWSIKAVLPTIEADLDYSRLTGVHNGCEAQSAYMECLLSPGEERKQIGEQLRRYCELDTFAMVAIARFFSLNKTI